MSTHQQFIMCGIFEILQTIIPYSVADPGGPTRPWFSHPFYLWTLSPLQRRK